MSRYIWVLLSFLIVTIPGAFNDWFSLFERFGSSEDDALEISFGDWYQAVFPILGFMILAFGIWWTRSKEKGGNPNQSNITPLEGIPQDTALEAEDTVPGPPADQASSLPNLPNNWSPSPSDLVAAYENRTTREAEEIVAPHLGRKLIVRVTVGDVDKVLFEENKLRVYSKDVDSDISIHATFEDSWNTAIQRLQINENITLLGTIYRITRSSISLEQCEIIVGFSE